MDRYELERKEYQARIELMEELAVFSHRVANGEATSEEIAYMSEMAKIVDQSKYERIKREVHHRMGTSLDFLSCL